MVRTLSPVREFQSTRPLRGATLNANSYAWSLIEFQSTRPLRGATVGVGSRRSVSIFQSTRPLRGAT